jgi:hypothetical protein
VVLDGGHPAEQCLLVDLADADAVVPAAEVEPGRDDVGPAVAVGRDQPADAPLAQVGEFG